MNDAQQTVEIGSKWHRLGPTGRPNTGVVCTVVRLTPGYVHYTVERGGTVAYGEYPFATFTKAFQRTKGVSE